MSLISSTKLHRAHHLSIHVGVVCVCLALHDKHPRDVRLVTC
jgi:hypothetical protein